MKRISIFIVFLLAASTLVAQKLDLVPVEKKKKEYQQFYIGEYKFKERNSYITFGFGLNFYPKLVNPNQNGNFSVDLHYFDKNDRFWHAGYQSNSQSYLLNSGNFVYLHSLKFTRALYMREKQYFKVAAFVGPSAHFTRYYPTDTLKSLAADLNFGVGIQSHVEFIFKPVYDIGIAVIPFVNVNTIQTVMGVTFAFYGSNAMVRKIK